MLIYLKNYSLFGCVTLTLICLCSLVKGDSCKKGAVNCLKCDGTNTTRCERCTQLVLRCSTSTTSSLITKCPPGYLNSASRTLLDFMEEACFGRNSSSGNWAAGTGAIIIILAVFIIGIVLFRKRQRWRRHQALSRRIPSTNASGASSDDGSGETVEFYKQLAELRTSAPLFLEMLNDTRRRVRDLLPNRSAAIQPYRPVLKDLSRILILLNRNESRLGPPPPDWETLLNWAHRMLVRYKKTKPMENDFISISETELAATFDTNYNNTRRHKRSEEEWPWSSQELDDYFSYGFRPQDEITTEL